MIINELIENFVLCRYKTAPPGRLSRISDDPEMLYDTEEVEYMECGPSPPAENSFSMYDSFEEPSSKVNIQICGDTIRTNLIEQMKLVGGHIKLLDDIECGKITIENAADALKGISGNEKNLCFLWSAFMKKCDMLQVLLNLGANLNYCDPNGISALHLAAFCNCVNSTLFLIGKGMDVNLQPKSYTPLHCASFGNSVSTSKILINNGAQLSIHTKRTNCEESLLHCAVRSNALDCLRLFVNEGADVNSLNPSGTSPIHLAASLGYSECLKILLAANMANPNIRVVTREKETTPLHLAAEVGSVECITILLAKGADVKMRNHRGATALHLAARIASVECVEMLLRNGNSYANAEDFEKRTPLHTAIGKADSVFEVIELLISWGADINQKDVFGHTALHIAALDGLTQCVELLIFHGADVTTKSRKGICTLNVITRKTPAALNMIHKKLDAAITLHYLNDKANREIEMELDFRQILQHCHPREISYMNTFIEEGQKEILEHPLCAAFLYIKWQKIRKFYIGRLVFGFLFTMFLTVYILTVLAVNCEREDENLELCQDQSILGTMLRTNPVFTAIQRYSLLSIAGVEIIRKVIALTAYNSVKRYVSQVENLMEWIIIISVLIIATIHHRNILVGHRHLGAFAVLLGWTNLMLMVGQLPVFGSYVAMYTKVQGEFGKLLMAYSCMLIGFTISFCVIFPAFPTFSNPFMALITVLVMMIGELDLSLLINDPNGKDPPLMLEVSAQIVYVLFLLFVTVILMNLLVGIAVHDIQGLKKTAGLSKLVRQTKLVSYIESALFNTHISPWLRTILHNSALVSPQAYRVVLCVKPLNPGEKRLPKDILMAAYQIAKQRKQLNPSQSSRNSDLNYDPFKKSANDFTTNYDSPDCEYSELESICTLTNKIDENTDKIDQLTNEVYDLKLTLERNHKLMDQLLHRIRMKSRVTDSVRRSQKQKKL